MTETPVAEKMSLRQMLFGFSGRIRRRDFWVYSSLNAGAALVASLVVASLVVVGLSELAMVDMQSMDTARWVGWAMIVALAPFGWIAAALNIKRLHDIGRSYRWWRINLVPVLGWAWTFLECGLRDGTPGLNPYGPSPKAALEPEKGIRMTGIPLHLVPALFRFEGRMRRRDYWFYVVFSGFALFIMTIGDVVVPQLILPRGGDTPAAMANSPAGMGISVLFTVTMGLWLWMSLALMGKRLHDRGKPLWWLLILAVPLAGWLWLFVECGFLEGDAGDNAFGPPAKAGPR